MDRMCSLEQDWSYEVLFDDTPISLTAYDSFRSNVLPAARPIVPKRLTALEEAVVALAAFDHRTSVEPAGLVGRLALGLFGGHPSNRLADERLEALRRFAVLYRLDGRLLPQDEHARLAEVGFSVDTVEQIEQLVALSATGR